MVNLSAHFPTPSDCRNIDFERIALHCHFSYMDKQVTIQSTSRGYCVMRFGFFPDCYRVSNISYEDLYCVRKFSNEEFHKAQLLFLSIVGDLLDPLIPF